MEPAPPATPPTPDHVRRLLTAVMDPELGADIVDLGMVREVSVSDDGRVDLVVGLTTLGCPLQHQIRADIRGRVGEAPGVTEVKVEWVELDQDQRSEVMAIARKAAADRSTGTAVPATTRILAIASGKGGVGKSSVTVNLAVALAGRGFRVGVLDADIGGYSVPRMLGADDRLSADEAGRILPFVRDVGEGQLEIVSMGNLVDDDATALMWNGKTLNRAVQHFLEDVAWGELDYLLVDMPPGTGDIQVGFGRLLPRAEVIVVTTPALTAQAVAVRAVDIARKSYLRVLGVVENMSAFTAPDGSVHALFGTGGGDALAEAAGVEVLARLPIEPAVSAGGDAGEPAALRSGPAARVFSELAARIVDDLAPPVSMAGCSARMLDAAAAALDEAGLTAR